MQEQNYKNHIRLVPLFHFIAYPLMLILLTGSAISCYKWYQLGGGYLVPSLLLISGVCIMMVALFARSFALKAQDRAIRAEENLRYFAMTGNLLDSKLTMQQIIALRFASNNEMLDLAHRAVAENLTATEIKKSIKHWKADHHRV